MKNYIHISSGRGPLECGIAVKNLLGMVLKEAKTHQVKTDVIDRITTSNPMALSSVTILVDGKDAEAFSKKWEGSVLWKCKSPLRPQHKRKNWFVEVFCLKAPDHSTIVESDVSFQATKSSGPGGQHVNKTSSAIRATHAKTGTTVLVQDSRSQHQNRKIALQRLEEKMNSINLHVFEDFESELWLKKINVQRGNPTRTFESKGFREVTKN